MGLIDRLKKMLSSIWAWLEKFVASEAKYLAEEKVKKAAKVKATAVKTKVEAKVEKKVESAKAKVKEKITETLDGAA